MTFTMRRNGTFQANWSDTKNSCGTDPSKRPTYTFACEIVTTDKLDDQAFMIDNQVVTDYFNNMYVEVPRYARSCELIARDAVFDLLRRLRTHGCTVLSLAVSISGSAQAELTACWTPEEEVYYDEYNSVSMEEVLGKPQEQYIVEVWSDGLGWRPSTNTGLKSRVFSTRSEAIVAMGRYASRDSILQYRVTKKETK